MRTGENACRAVDTLLKISAEGQAAMGNLKAPDGASADARATASAS